MTNLGKIARRFITLKVDILKEVKAMISELCKDGTKSIEVDVRINEVNKHSLSIIRIFPDGSLETDDGMGNVYEAFSDEIESISDLNISQLFDLACALEDIKQV